MKSKITILLLALFALASCETDNMIANLNPEAEKGTLSFVLNKPTYANFTYELLESNSGDVMDMLFTTQPDFGFTAAVTYYVEVSLNADMSNSVLLATSVQGEVVPVNVRDMNNAIVALNDGSTPNTAVDVYVRLRAVISTATPSPLDPNPTVKPLFSNAIKLSIKPFAPSLMPFYEVPTLNPYFIIGYNGWDNSAAGLGLDVIPMGVQAGNYYNRNGDGTFVFTGYFEASKEFKLIGVIGNWNIQWGNGGGVGINNPEFGGNPSNFRVPTDGYYTITLNSIDNILTIEPIPITPAVWTNMGVVGTITNWTDGNDIAMIPVFPTNNHVWFATVTVTATDKIKFRYNGTWDVNWGVPGDSAPLFFPTGIAARGNSDIQTLGTGTYIVFFNDIDGSFTFIKK